MQNLIFYSTVMLNILHSVTAATFQFRPIILMSDIYKSSLPIIEPTYTSTTMGRESGLILQFVPSRVKEAPKLPEAIQFRAAPPPTSSSKLTMRSHRRKHSTASFMTTRILAVRPILPVRSGNETVVDPMTDSVTTTDPVTTTSQVPTTNLVPNTDTGREKPPKKKFTGYSLSHRHVLTSSTMAAYPGGWTPEPPESAGDSNCVSWAFCKKRKWYTTRKLLLSKRTLLPHHLLK